jgi:IS5 family transposase
LLAKAVNRIAATGRRIRAAGGAVRTKLRDRSRAAGRRAHDLNAKLRTRSATAKEEALEVGTARTPSSPTWLRPQRRRPNGCCPMPRGLCARRRSTPRSRRPTVTVMR